MGTKYLDMDKFFEEIRMDDETLDECDENFFDIHDAIRESEEVAYHEWDGGHAGVGCGRASIYFFRGYYIVDDEIEYYGPFISLQEALSHSNVFKNTSVTKKIWIKPISKG